MEVLTLRNSLLGHSFVFRLSVLLFTKKYKYMEANAHIVRAQNTAPQAF